VVLALGELAQVNSPDPKAIAIEFDAPPMCSSAKGFYEGVRSRTNRVRWAQDGDAATTVRIRLFRAGAKIKGELRLSDQEGEKETRKVDGSTCEEVVEALALTVTLALDPDALFANRIPEAKTREYPEGTVPSPKVSSASSLALPSPAHVNPGHLELGAQWMVATVILPGMSFGPAIGGRFVSGSSRWGHYSYGLAFSYLRNDIFGGTSHGEFSLMAAAAELCPWRTKIASPADFGVCAIASGGRLGATGVDLDHPATRFRSWWSAGLSALVSAQLVGNWRLSLSIGGTVPLIRRGFAENGAGETVASSPWVALQSGIGLIYRF